MSQERIEKRFQNALGGYASEVDDELLWSEIEDKLPQKKKKRRFLLWFIFGLPLLVMFFISLWNILPNNSDITDGGLLSNIES